MLYPLTFQPIFKERVWGGRRLQELYGKPLPTGVRIGESWEITDRPEGVSVITNGPLAGRSLRWLMENHGAELLGNGTAVAGRFPLLVKLLDARDVLSLQVHPPAAMAAALGGEPKSEMWYFTDTTSDACIHVGLRRGVTRGEFERRIRDGSVADCIHRIAVRRGDAMFLPSGRVHALGAGCVLVEIQQNSDTTYRVFDWNRTGLDGKPRELHIEQALASIDFSDFEPSLAPGESFGNEVLDGVRLVDNPLFTVSRVCLQRHDLLTVRSPVPLVLGVLDGTLEIAGEEQGQPLTLKPGEFCLLPANVTATLSTPEKVSFLQAVVGQTS